MTGCPCVPRVVQSAVLLSDSRLHLFLQSQLPVAAIEACVQGRGPHSVTEAILHYALGHRGDSPGLAWGHRGDSPGLAWGHRGDGPAPPGAR